MTDVLNIDKFNEQESRKYFPSFSSYTLCNNAEKNDYIHNWKTRLELLFFVDLIVVSLTNLAHSYPGFTKCASDLQELRHQ